MVNEQQDTLKYDTLQVGLLSLKNKLKHPVTITLFEKDRKVYQREISSFDSTTHYLKTSSILLRRLSRYGYKPYFIPIRQNHHLFQTDRHIKRCRKPHRHCKNH